MNPEHRFSQGFPGARPAAGLKAWVRQSQHPVAHFYAAYPEATTREVLAAIEVSERLGSFRSETRDATPAQFAAAYERLLIDPRREL